MRQTMCVVVSSVWPLQNFLFDQLSKLSERYDVLVVANTDNENFLADLGLEVEVLPLPIERDIHLVKDLVALLALVRLFRRRRFSMVHSFSPKGGLLAMVASFLARVPVRVHTFTGQVWVTRSGLARTLLKGADRLIGHLATQVFVDSLSQKDFLVNERVVDAGKSAVLAKGSLSGVDTTRFKPDRCARARIRAEQQLPESDFVFLFMGRLSKDKGLLDLAAAFCKLCGSHADIRLLIVGPDEGGIRQKMLDVCGIHGGRIHFVDYSKVPEQYMAAADVLCLPSYREGFGSVILEAAAVGIPAIGSRIYGITDAIREGETGLLHQAADVEALHDAMVQMIENPDLRKTMGENARHRALKDFGMNDVSSALLSFYAMVLRSRS